MLARIPWRLVGYVLAAVLALAALNHFAGFVPFTPQWQARQLSKKVGELNSQVSTLEREATGNAEIGQAVETFHTREVIVREIAAQAETEARDAPDATTPLSQERAARLRSHDIRLCDEFPGFCADPDPAAGSAPAVPPAGPAG